MVYLLNHQIERVAATTIPVKGTCTVVQTKAQS